MNNKVTTKIEHIWSVLCQTSLIDIDTNNLSLLNIVEQLTVSSVPQITPTVKDGLKVQKKGGVESHNIPVSLEITSFFQRRDLGTGELKSDAMLTLLDPKGKILKENMFQIVFPNGSKRLRFRAKLNGIPITTPGEYRFLLKIKDGKNFREVSSLPVDIKIEVKI